MPNEEAKLAISLKSINKDRFLVQQCHIIFFKYLYCLSYSNAEVTPGGTGWADDGGG